jgi:hypothetical protein
MALFSEFMGLHRDMPLGPLRLIPSVSGGTSSDYEYVVASIPDLTKLAKTGQSGSLPLNILQARLAILIPEANITGATAHYFTWNLLQKRAGALLVNTTTSTAVSSAGSVAITPAAMTNIAVGTSLLVDTGESPETVIVSAVTATTFTATFANTHSSTWNIVSSPLMSISYNSSSVTETALVPHQFALLAPNILLANDVLTFQRVSNDSTGLASPATMIQIDWVPTQRIRPAS